MEFYNHITSEAGSKVGKDREFMTQSKTWCSMIAQNLVNDRYDNSKSECWEWEDENEVNFERKAVAFFIDN